MSERTEYRDNLEELKSHFPGKHLITKKETAEFLGIDVRTAARRYNIGAEGITLASLARRLCNS